MLYVCLPHFFWVAILRVLKMDTDGGGAICGALFVIRF